MRVTQSMLSNNMLRNLTSSYEQLGKYQEQLTTGKKINKPSDNPVIAMKGITYRTNLDQVTQYQRNIGEVYSWLDSSDDALDKVGSTIQRIQELMVQASSDSLTPDDREKLKSEIEQLQEHIQSLGNTKVGDKYIFSGTKTNTPLFDSDGTPNPDTNETGIKIEVYNGVELQVNTKGKALFENMNQILSDISSDLSDNTLSGADFNKYLTQLDGQMNQILTARADIGARQNRAEMMENRLDTQEVIVTKQLSENEDIDYEKTITDLITQESIHRAALSVGSRIIQPTLMDFLR
ncbi:flagellar hook-associated protein FlgL [Robertmurraya massiliosenegalensis]|uniref:flagellar hook-associated protein FlgL n=1 Tax=Robertmurraya massiliosenegalensis TaxID=1287657 RepID=UPI0002FD8E98|nr:flagellar hook-associated protein FlgL [Robertmurraya massiliosenegalensis]